MTLRRNTLINLGGQASAVVISLAAVPPLLRWIGEARYGVMLVVWVLLGYFALFDLGVSQATTQRMARLRDAPDNERAGLLWTALAMNVGMGLVAALVLLFAGHLILGRVVSMDAQLRTESLAALPWIALALPVSMAASAFTGALQGREAFGSTTLAGILGQVLAQGLPLFVAWRYSVSLEWLIPAALVARLATAVLLFVLCKRIVPLVGAPTYDRAAGRSLLSYGGWITVSSIIGPLMSSCDRLVIGAISGSEAITYYGVPQGLAARLLMLPSSISGALLPRLAGSSEERRESLASVSASIVACVMTPAALVGLFLVGPFLSVWISPSFASRASTSAQVLMVGVWFNGLAMVAHSSLLARGRPDLVAKMHIVELPAYLLLLAATLYLWGVTGAAIAWTTRVAVDALLLYGMSGLLRTFARRFWVPAALLLLGLVVLHLQDRLPFLVWPGACLTGLLALVWSYREVPRALLPSWLSARIFRTP